jgi:hypothetical protein
MRYFSKELPEAAIYIFGHPMTFDVMETSDPALIAEFQSAISRNSGGISEITAEKFAEEVKKKESEKLSGGSLRPSFKRTELSALQFGNPGAAVASRFSKPQQSEWSKGPGTAPEQARQMPDPVDIPTSASFIVPPPPTARMKESKQKQI